MSLAQTGSSLPCSITRRNFGLLATQRETALSAMHVGGVRRHPRTRENPGPENYPKLKFNEVRAGLPMSLISQAYHTTSCDPESRMTSLEQRPLDICSSPSR